jgi:DNA-binding transcriptional ArsR family regulator
MAVDLTSHESAVVIESLASTTARDIVAALAADPATASDLADRVETTLQNVQYHLDRLRDAGLVTRAGTWYSTKGREMTVYATTSERIELGVDTAPAPCPVSGVTPRHEGTR